jgi:hypothetical protein
MPEMHALVRQVIERAPDTQLQEIALQALDTSGPVMAALMFARDPGAQRLADDIFICGDAVARELDHRNVFRSSLLALMLAQEQGVMWLRDHRRVLRS